MMDDPDETWRWAKLDDLDVIWNLAADYGADGEAPEGTPLGKNSSPSVGQSLAATAAT